MVNIFKKIYRLKNKFHIVGFSMHKNDNLNPFFIIGSGRSGNTLLRRILNEHSELYIPPETYVMGETIDIFKRNRNMEWPHLVRLIYSTYQFHPEFDTFDINNLSQLVMQVSNDPKEHRSLSHIFNSFYEYYKNSHSLTGKRWGDKTPYNTFYLNNIHKVFPEAQFIHIIRDPYDSIYSYVKSGIYSNYIDAATRWKKSIELSCDFGHKFPNKYYEIKYEELVNEPESYIKEICAFLTINFEKKMLDMSDKSKKLGDVQTLAHHENVLKPISNKYIGLGLKNLSQIDKTLIDNVLRNSRNEYIMKLLNDTN